MPAQISHQPHPVIADPYDAQTLNRYAYAYDNPRSSTDPSGLCEFPCTLGRIFLGPVKLAIGGGPVASASIAHPYFVDDGSKYFFDAS